jgi:hypothetical protein
VVSLDRFLPTGLQGAVDGRGGRITASGHADCEDWQGQAGFESTPAYCPLLCRILRRCNEIDPGRGRDGKVTRLASRAETCGWLLHPGLDSLGWATSSPARSLRAGIWAFGVDSDTHSLYPEKSRTSRWPVIGGGEIGNANMPWGSG